MYLHFQAKWYPRVSGFNLQSGPEVSKRVGNVYMTITANVFIVYWVKKFVWNEILHVHYKPRNAVVKL